MRLTLITPSTLNCSRYCARCSLLNCRKHHTRICHNYLTWYQYLNFSISDRFRLLLWLPNRTRPTLGVFDLNPDSQTSLLMRIFRNKSNAPSPKT
jgi:hypothetical protein